jgi:hypothetical protein
MKNLKITILVCFTLCLSRTSMAQFIGNNPIQQGSAGNVGIGFPAYTPSSLLQVRNGSVLFEGTTGGVPISGAGTRMMWIPSKAAFRAGTVPGPNWDNVNIGVNSFAVGNATVASGKESFACGWVCQATGLSSFSTGNMNFATGSCSFATGAGNTAGGVSAAVFGAYNNAQAYSSFVIGQYSVAPGNYNPTSWVLTDPLFVIGNGINGGSASNALTVLKNGNIGIGNINPTEKLIVNGNVGIGTSSTGSYRLAVEGKVGAREVVVTNASWADFVFDTNYKLVPLNEIKEFVKVNKHLPEIPTAAEIEKNGLSVGEIQTKQMQKIEELTLYLIQQNERIEMLEKVINGMR